MKIELTKLYPNPSNPRKQLGDLAELTESIKANGVMQQLTVNDNGDGTYTIIIGHRRAEAAKQAGLNEVPCEVIKADKQKQIAMMLVENMTREDLTIDEQAKAVQQCLDLGMTADELKEKTGFTKKKITNFKKIAKLNMEKAPVNATIDDFLKIADIKDQDKQEELIEKIGSNLFGWEVEQAKKREKDAEIQKKINEFISSNGIKVEKGDWDSDEYVYEKSLNSVEQLEELIKSGEKYKLVQDYDSIDIYLERNGEEDYDDIAEVKANEEAEKKRDELSDVCFNTRRQFVRDMLKNGINDKDYECMVSMIASRIIFDEHDISEIEELLDIDFEKIEDDPKLYLTKMGLKKEVLIALYISNQSGNGLPVSWDGTYSKESYRYDSLNNEYQTLINIGYEPSEQEKAMLNGTSEVYKESK